MNCNFQARTSYSSDLGVEQCLMSVVYAFATVTRHFWGILFTVGIEVEKMSINEGSKHVGLTKSPSALNSSTLMSSAATGAASRDTTGATVRGPSQSDGSAYGHTTVDTQGTK